MGHIIRLLKKKLKRLLVRTSLKNILLWLFVPVFIFCISANLFLTNVFIRRQVRDNAMVSIAGLVSQTKYYLDYRLYGIFEQMVLFEQGADMTAFVAHPDEDKARRHIRFVQIFTELERIYNVSFSILDSVFVAVQQGVEPIDVFYKFYYPPYKSGFSFSMVMNGEPLIAQGKKSYQWLNLHENEIYPNNYTDNRTASLYKVAGDESSASRYFILFNFRNDFFRQIFGNIKVAENGYLALLGDGAVMSFQDNADSYRIPKPVLQKIEASQDGTGNLVYQDQNGAKMAVIWEPLRLGHWKLAAIFPEDGLMYSVNNIRLIMVVCSFIAIGFALILSLLIIRVISTPINRWVSKINAVRSENSDVLLDDAICEEMVEFNKGITQLMEQVKRLGREKLLEEEQKRKLAIRILHEQIKPHFLYNALSSIEQLGTMGENKKMIEIVRALTGFYRLSLSKGREHIELKDEIAHAEYYLNIQMIHCKKIFYRIQLDPQFLNVKIPKLSLQPILENVIFHAMKFGEDIHLDITAEQAGKDVEIKVSDDGIGIPGDKLDVFCRAFETNDWSVLPEVFGIRNVHERVRLHYGSPYGVSIESVFEQGTTVTILVPRDQD